METRSDSEVLDLIDQGLILDLCDQLLELYRVETAVSSQLIDLLLLDALALNFLEE